MKHISTSGLSCQDYYKKALSSHEAAYKATQSYESFTLQANSHSLLCELSEWEKVLYMDYEKEMLKLCCEDFAKALLHTVIAEYKAAFFHIRSCLELGLLLIEYSAHPILYRGWVNGDNDVVWASLTDKEKGVFSQIYTKAYFPELENEAIRINALAKTSYRKCSEFVHGNPCSWNSLSEDVGDSEKIFKECHERFENISYILQFALSMRFLKDMSTNETSIIEPIIVENLLHIKPIQDFLQNMEG